MINTNDYLEVLIRQWHHDRGLIDGTTDQAQFVKLMEEVGELAGNIARGRDISDDIGDIIVVLINIATRNGLTLRQCMQTAYDDIKDRSGKMVDGTFVKEDDLVRELIEQVKEDEEELVAVRSSN